MVANVWGKGVGGGGAGEEKGAKCTKWNRMTLFTKIEKKKQTNDRARKKYIQQEQKCTYIIIARPFHGLRFVILVHTYNVCNFLFLLAVAVPFLSDVLVGHPILLPLYFVCAWD